MLASRAAPGAFAATFVALAILISLGQWQLHRLHWKQAMLARIAAAEQVPPAALAGDAAPPLFTRVSAHGVLRGDRLALYGAEVRGDRMGAQDVQVLDRVGDRPLLLVLGWVPTGGLPSKPQTGPRDVTGYVRLPERPNFLSAADDPEGRRFYSLDPAAIGTALGAPDVAKFTLVALRNPLGAALPAGAPMPAEALPQPPNNHLQYALTWFGLAGALLAVFGAWVFARRPTGL